MKSRRTILYIVSTLSRSGPTNQLYSLIKYLDRDKIAPNVLTLSPEPKDTRWNDFDKLNINLYSLNLSRVSGILRGRRGLKQLVDRLKPDIIHSQGIRGDNFSAVLDIKIPKVATIHNFPQYDYPMTYGKILGKIMERKHTCKMDNLDKCVGVSESVSENLYKKYGIDNVTPIKNGVDTDKFYPVSYKKKRKIRRQLQIPVDKKVWISTGHLSKRKDPISIIKSFKRVFNKNKGHFLLFLGDGDLKSQCIDLANNHDIHFTGRVSNVIKYLQASDYFISASKAEGLPMAVVEAMACGLPVLLSNIGPHQEIFNLNNEIGELFNLNSDEELQNKLKVIPAQSYDQMRKASMKTINENLSARVMSSHYQQLYSKL